MGVLGVSILVASVVYVIAFPVDWLPQWLQRFRRGCIGKAITQGPTHDRRKEQDGAGRDAATDDDDSTAKTTAIELSEGTSGTSRKAREDTSMPPPPPPPPPPTIQPPTLQEPTNPEPNEQTTPKATASERSQAVPSFSLSEEPSPPSKQTTAPTVSAPAPWSMMPPPPRPSSIPNRLPQFPAANSAQRARGPLPNRGPLANPSASTSPGLAPPSTHLPQAAKPSRKVLLEPGRSPLDWARISGPNADLRGLPPSTPYLRVTPSMLKRQTGRKGKDAWMGLNGKVYNVTPYAEFHPGGVPELMRGAGRDGTKLFGEIHPWVNYETMLSSCLIGLLVDEPEGNQESEMDKMD
ncbi:Cytochrome b5 reductase-like protein [Hapsidospora chrysogenum ATCC 11550]|uniref:Cytochrome b5 reductase-like protein n=1 Tax=Hapsidospora chrysogenum (strain ATCC 11550 / CBS 779.69 / DSM 880 / IAM 14645 / JCM 23072 / IMI 49137) TaxID=857340 RepID=A0A086T698_HAPC1|nr:Cytochrome b5 reductase-like protein [Hapsidospora chrysogenum ATCC 11550]